MKGLRRGPTRPRRGGMPHLEIACGEVVATIGSEEAWQWSSAAGRVRLHKRTDLIARALDVHSEPKRLLELGCGDGAYTAELAPFATELLATDISEALLVRARERDLPAQVRFVRQDLENLSIDQLGGGFQGVFGCSVLHHLDLDRVLPQLKPLLAPGASLAFSEPNLLNPQVQVMFSGWEWTKRRWLVADSEMAFYPWELRSIFSRHGFEVVELRAFDFMHPGLPNAVVSAARYVDRFLERAPLLRWFGASCFIHVRIPVNAT